MKTDVFKKSEWCWDTALLLSLAPLQAERSPRAGSGRVCSTALTRWLLLCHTGVTPGEQCGWGEAGRGLLRQGLQRRASSGWCTAELS